MNERVLVEGLQLWRNAFHITSRILYIYMTIKFCGNTVAALWEVPFVLQCGRAFEVFKIDPSIDPS